MRERREYTESFRQLPASCVQYHGNQDGRTIWGRKQRWPAQFVMFRFQLDSRTQRSGNFGIDYFDFREKLALFFNTSSPSSRGVKKVHIWLLGSIEMHPNVGVTKCCNSKRR